MKPIAKHTLAITVLASALLLAPLAALAHGHHHPRGCGHKVVVVKHKPGKKVVVVGHRRHRCHHHPYRPGRVLVHAIADAVWWDATH